MSGALIAAEALAVMPPLPIVRPNSPPASGATPCPAGHLEKYGELVEQTANHIQLKVKRDRVIAVCKALLDELPVTDIDIQEVPIENIIRQIFARA